MRIITMIIFLMAFSTSGIFSIYAQDTPAAVPSLETTGTITSIDKDNRLLQIKSYVKQNISTYKMLEIYVKDKAEIMKDGKSISFSDLSIDDKVSVEYFTDPEGRPNAVGIALNE
jgi:hypothetical protein